MAKKKCLQCGEPVSRNRYDYCSIQCYGLSNRNRIYRDCLHCGMKFHIAASHAPRNGASCCSRKCRKRHAIACVEARFWSHVEKTETCWLWIGGSSRYPNFYYCTESGKRTQDGAHRFSYRLHVGPIPDGLFVCHTCDVKHCVNPGHLFLGTLADNVHDMCDKGKQPKGIRCGSAKLTEESVLAIRAKHADGVPFSVLGREFGVSVTQVARVARRMHWRHLA